jgi:uncharacterized protein YdeI (YjbR/CyaY-like superfamily)
VEEIIAFADAGQWESWLGEHYEGTTGVWLKIAKKSSGKASITVAEALDVALCYGWIDSQRKAHDDAHYLQRYSPRRPDSSWSLVNVHKAKALIAAGRVREPGLAAIRAAQADGRWAAAYESQRTAMVPDDLAAALADNAPARERFERLNRTDQYGLFLRLIKAKTPRRPSRPAPRSDRVPLTAGRSRVTLQKGRSSFAAGSSSRTQVQSRKSRWEQH